MNQGAKERRGGVCVPTTPFNGTPPLAYEPPIRPHLLKAHNLTIVHHLGNQAFNTWAYLGGHSRPKP
jgi:hypothetical protein